METTTSPALDPPETTTTQASSPDSAADYLLLAGITTADLPDGFVIEETVLPLISETGAVATAARGHAECDDFPGRVPLDAFGTDSAGIIAFRHPVSGPADVYLGRHARRGIHARVHGGRPRRRGTRSVCSWPWPTCSATPSRTSPSPSRTPTRGHRSTGTGTISRDRQRLRRRPGRRRAFRGQGGERYSRIGNVIVYLGGAAEMDALAPVLYERLADVLAE